MIDAHFPGQAGAQGQLALDAAARRHDGVVGKQHRAYLAILVSPAGIAQQGAVLLSPAEFLGRDEAAFPESAAIVLRAGLVVPEPASGVGLEIQSEALADGAAVQAGALPLDGANPHIPRLVRTEAEVLATHLAAADQLG